MGNAAAITCTKIPELGWTFISPEQDALYGKNCAA